MSQTKNSRQSKFVWPKITYNSPVILTYAIVSFAVLFIGARTNPILYLEYFSSPNHIDPLSPTFYFQLVSWTFGHSGLSHYYNNFLIILLVGPLLEEKWRPRTLATMMLVTAVATALLNAILFDTRLIGASGVATMLLILASVSNVRRGELPLTLIAAVFVWLGGDVAAAGSDDGISHFGHIVGGLFGGLFGLFWKQFPELKEHFQNWLGKRLSPDSREQ